MIEIIKMIDANDFKGFKTFIYRKPISVEYKKYKIGRFLC